MGDLYNPFPKLPKNIRQIGDPDQVIRFYMEDYVNTYLKRLYPSGSQTAAGGTFAGKRGTVRRDSVCVCGRGHGDGGCGDRRGKDRLYRKRMEKGVPGHGGSVSQAHDPGVVSLRRAGSQLSPANYWKQHCPVFCRKEPAHVSEPWPGGRGGHLCDLRRTDFTV